MIRSLTLLWASLAVICGVALFLVKYQVQSLEGRLLTIDRTIRQDRMDIHVLHAEWAYLNDPKRLADEAGKYLSLAPPVSDQYASIAELPLRPPALDDPSAMSSLVAGKPNPWASFPLKKPEAPPAKTVLSTITAAANSPAAPPSPAASKSVMGGSDFAGLTKLIKTGAHP